MFCVHFHAAENVIAASENRTIQTNWIEPEAIHLDSRRACSFANQFSSVNSDVSVAAGLQQVFTFQRISTHHLVLLLRMAVTSWKMKLNLNRIEFYQMFMHFLTQLLNRSLTLLPFILNSHSSLSCARSLTCLLSHSFQEKFAGFCGPTHHEGILSRVLLCAVVSHRAKDKDANVKSETKQRHSDNWHALEMFRMEPVFEIQRRQIVAHKAMYLHMRIRNSPVWIIKIQIIVINMYDVTARFDSVNKNSPFFTITSRLPSSFATAAGISCHQISLLILTDRRIVACQRVHYSMLCALRLSVINNLQYNHFGSLDAPIEIDIMIAYAIDMYVAAACRAFTVHALAHAKNVNCPMFRVTLGAFCK